MSNPSNQEQIETKSYLTKMLEIVGVKGIILTLGLLALTALTSLEGTDALISAEAGAAVAVLLGLGVVIEKKYMAGEAWDRVGIGAVLVSVAYAGFRYSSLPVDYKFAGGAGVFLLGVVIYDYWKSSMSDGEDTMRGRTVPERGEKESRLMNIDIVGFFASEVIIIYSLLSLGGYYSFIHSPIFPAFAFIFAVSMFAIAAGYRIISPEIVVSGPSEELNRNIIGILRDLKDLEDENLRKDIAAKIRLIYDDMEGTTVPSDVQDQHGRIPIMLPTARPSVVYDEIRTEDLLEDIKERRFTGVVIDSGSKVILFRNGRHVKYCLGDDDFRDDIELLKREFSKTGVEGYELEHSVLNELEAVTPRPESEEEEKTDEEEVEELKQKLDEEQKKKQKGEGATLNVGGDEIDMEEMFEKADEILDELNE